MGKTTRLRTILVAAVALAAGLTAGDAGIAHGYHIDRYPYYGYGCGYLNPLVYGPYAPCGQSTPYNGFGYTASDGGALSTGVAQAAYAAAGGPVLIPSYAAYSPPGGSDYPGPIFSPARGLGHTVPGVAPGPGHPGTGPAYPSAPSAPPAGASVESLALMAGSIGSDGTVYLSWTAPFQATVATYQLIRLVPGAAPEVVGAASSGNMTSRAPVVAGAVNAFVLVAADASGNIVAVSNSVQVTTLAAAR